MGHEAYLIEERLKLSRSSYRQVPLSYGKRILRNLTGHPFPIFYEQKVNREIPIVSQYTERFIEKYIKRRIVDEFSEIKETDFDAIVVGSDQIWRPQYYPQIEHAYLDFAEGWSIRRLSYAASFGTEEWEYTPKQTAECGRLLKKFDAVSVREASGVRLCVEYFGVKAVHVLDPTMLLSAGDYAALFEAAGTPKSGGNLLCYILDETPEKAALIARIAEEKGLIPFRGNSKVENPLAPLAERIQPPVEAWLRGFYDAEFVVTDSFHACVFSILFGKPFIVVGNVSRGLSRFDSLLGMFGLEDRMVSENAMTADAAGGVIDWKAISVQLEQQREAARQYITQALS